VRARTIAIICAAAMVSACMAGEVAEEDVVLKIQVEHLGVVRGVSPVVQEAITAMAFSPEGMAAGAVKLEPGDYTLLVECYAPAGDQDGFFVEIAGQRTRRTAPIGNWGTLAYPFTVKEARDIGITVIGQEPGMTVDAVAVVKGTHKDNDPRLADVPGDMKAGMEISLADIPRLSMGCSLAEMPDAPFERDDNTVYLEHFEEPCAGASGEYTWNEGKWGKALYVNVPDGRFVIDATSLELGDQGTIEWWVKPRPAQELWYDQGWHYLLHCHARTEDGLQLDLSRHPRTNLRMIASSSEDPYYVNTEPGTREWVDLSTRELDLNEWHHILVSWDMTGEREHIWMMVDGRGKEHFFPKAHEATGFSTITLGNTPPEWDVPFLFMDGGIDEVRIQNVSVVDRLAQ